MSTAQALRILTKAAPKGWRTKHTAFVERESTRVRYAGGRCDTRRDKDDTQWEAGWVGAGLGARHRQLTVAVRQAVASLKL